MRKYKNPLNLNATLSGFAFEIDFGKISPNVRIITVMITVFKRFDSVGFKMNFENKYAQMVVEAMLTRLFPTKIVESALSECSQT